MKTDIHIWSYLARFFLEWEIFQTELIEKIKTHFMICIFFNENRAIYEKIWKKNIVDPDRTQVTIKRRVRFACWLP